MANKYDSIAGIYDILSRLVFGKVLQRSQAGLLKWMSPESRVLIVGGGTGWILERIAADHPAGLDIVYVEASAKMVALSRKRKSGENTVTFICLPIEEYTFTCLITFCLRRQRIYLTSCIVGFVPGAGGCSLTFVLMLNSRSCGKSCCCG